ncbi:MAG: hypothetical protein QXI12_04130 [Candidatus Methanomethyliaceae archaeon]
MKKEIDNVNLPKPKYKKWATAYLPEDISKRLDRYMSKVASEKGISCIHGLKTKIFQSAIEEWLERHEEDIDFVSL